MSMITCRECGKEFSDQAESCPNCGAPTRISRPFGIPYETPIKKEKKKMSVCLLISFLIGALYFVYIFAYFVGVGASSTDVWEGLGVGIATALVAPHILCEALAVIFNGLGCFMKRKGFALTGAILYAVSIFLFPMYFMFVIIECVLSFVGYALMKE